MTDWSDLPDQPDLGVEDLGGATDAALADGIDTAAAADTVAELGLTDAFGEGDDIDQADDDAARPEPTFGSSYHTDFWGNEWKTYDDGHVEKLN